MTLAETTGRRNNYVTLAVVTVLVLWTGLAYLNGLNGEFVYDDNTFIIANPKVQTLEHPGRFFFQPETYASLDDFFIYRPLASLSLAANYHFSGDNPKPYHAVNYALHLANVVMLFFLLRAIFGSDWAAGLGALIYAVHPRNVESVSWIASRSSVMFMFFFLAGLLCHLRAYEKGRKGWFYSAASVGAYAVALLSKEMAITFPAVLLAYDFLVRRKEDRPGIKRMAPYYATLGLVALGYLAVRTAALGAVAQQDWHGGSLFTNTLYALECVACYAAMSVWTLKPLALSVNYPFPQEGTPGGLSVAISLAAVAGICAGAWMSRKRYPALSFGLAWFLITILPVSNLAPLATSVNDRMLYLPMAGLAIALVWAIGKLWGLAKTKRGLAIASTAVVVALAGALTAQTVERNQDWRDFRTLFDRARIAYPEDTRHLTALGLWYKDRNQLDKAVECLEQARDNRVVALVTLSETHLEMGHYQRATAIAEELVKNRLKPGSQDMRDTLVTLGMAYQMGGRFDDADKAFNRALKEDPKCAEAYLELGRLYGFRKEYDKATGILEEGRREIPTNQSILTVLGLVYLGTGREEKALEAWKEAERLYPESADIMNNLAWVYVTSTDAKKRRPEEGLRLAREAVSRFPDNRSYMGTLAKALEVNGRLDESAKVLRGILALLPKESPETKMYNEQLEELKKKTAASGSPKAAE